MMTNPETCGTCGAAYGYAIVDGVETPVVCMTCDSPEGE